MLGTQGAHQRVLDEIVGEFGVAGQRSRVAAQGRNGRFDIVAKAAHDRRFLSSGCVPARANTGCILQPNNTARIFTIPKS